jgi:hypothetical protein
MLQGHLISIAVIFIGTKIFELITTFMGADNLYNEMFEKKNEKKDKDTK